MKYKHHSARRDGHPYKQMYLLPQDLSSGH